MRKAFTPLVIITAALFACTPIAIAQAPYESTMGLVQKIFYYHVPSWIAMYTAIAVCGVASLIYLFKGTPAADRVAVSAAEVTVLFGMIGLVTGPLWARRAWGVWWDWDIRLTSALLLELTFVAYLLVREYGGPGSEKLAAATGLFGTAVAPFVYVSVNFWRTIHPKTTVLPSLPRVFMVPMLLSATAFLLLCVLLLMVRVQLANRQGELDELYLAQED
jgi:heme exporter protein C